MTENYEQLKNKYDKPIKRYRELLKNDEIIKLIHYDIFDFNSLLFNTISMLDLTINETSELQWKVDNLLNEIKRLINEKAYLLEKGD